MYVCKRYVNILSYHFCRTIESERAKKGLKKCCGMWNAHSIFMTSTVNSIKFNCTIVHNIHSSRTVIETKFCWIKRVFLVFVFIGKDIEMSASFDDELPVSNARKFCLQILVIHTMLIKFIMQTVEDADSSNQMWWNFYLIMCECWRSLHRCFHIHLHLVRQVWYRYIYWVRVVFLTMTHN